MCSLTIGYETVETLEPFQPHTTQLRTPLRF
jgi:hypothetical protein